MCLTWSGKGIELTAKSAVMWLVLYSCPTPYLAHLCQHLRSCIFLWTAADYRSRAEALLVISSGRTPLFWRWGWSGTGALCTPFTFRTCAFPGQTGLAESNSGSFCLCSLWFRGWEMCSFCCALCMYLKLQETMGLSNSFPESKHLPLAGLKVRDFTTQKVRIFKNFVGNEAEPYIFFSNLFSNLEPFITEGYKDDYLYIRTYFIYRFLLTYEIIVEVITRNCVLEQVRGRTWATSC